MAHVRNRRAALWSAIAALVLSAAGSSDAWSTPSGNADLTIFIQGSRADVRVVSVVDPAGRGTADTLAPIPGLEAWDAVLDADVADTNAARPVALVHIPEPMPGLYQVELAPADSTLISVNGSVHRHDGGYCGYSDVVLAPAASPVLTLVRYEMRDDSCTVSIKSQ